MSSYTFKMEVVTPLFLSGADQTQAELRAPSIKGALRFWFRAMMGDSLLSLKAKEDDDPESRLFGSTSHRSAIAISVGNLFEPTNNLSDFSQEIGYLGYGPLAYDKTSKKFKRTRPCWAPTTEFTLMAQLPDDGILNRDFLGSLWLLCNFGGLGSRSRRGLGSIQVKSCDPPISTLPMNITARTPQELRNHLQKGLTTIFGNTPPSLRPLPTFSAFSKETRIYVYPEEFPTWQKALETIGRKMIDYRLRGPHPKRPTGTQNVGSDYLSVKGFLDSGNLVAPPSRAAFGLPHNYFFSSRKRNNQPPWEASFEGKDHDRRASPLMIHITKLSNGKFTLVITYLKAVFLPKDEKLRAIAGRKNARDRKERSIDQPSDKAITDFLSLLGVDKLEVKLP